VDSNSSPMLRSHCCFILWLEASWRSCLSHECGAVGAVDVAVQGCEGGAGCFSARMQALGAEGYRVVSRSASSLSYQLDPRKRGSLGR
jgi:hypothetical protein